MVAPVAFLDDAFQLRDDVIAREVRVAGLVGSAGGSAAAVPWLLRIGAVQPGVATGPCRIIIFSTSFFVHNPSLYNVISIISF